jgi:type IV secretion system protein TrbJ
MRRIMTILLTVVTIVSTSSISTGIIPVIDESALVQTTLTAFRALESNVNEGRMLAQQVQGYIQDAKGFVALPQSVVGQITSTIQQYYDILQQSRGLSYSVTSAVQQYDTLFASGAGGGSALQRAPQMLSAMRDMGRVATQASALYERLCKSRSDADLLLRASQAAPGQLAAQQAGNQLIGMMLEQQGAMQELNATMGRVQMGWIMKQAVEEEATTEKAAHWLDGWPGSGPTERVTLPGGD